jgi:UDP:flavonoid glycosyltransferase YjiC (YdhE family)
MSRKKVLLIGPPFSGHLHPLLGIGKGMATVADVLVVCTPKGVKEAVAAGLRSRVILAEKEHVVMGISEPGHAVKNNPLRLLGQLRENVGVMLEVQSELAAIYMHEKPDLVIADSVVPVAGITAMRHGIAWWTAISSPCVIETPDGPPAYFKGQLPARTTFQRLRHSVMRKATKGFKHLAWLLFRRVFIGVGFHGIYRSDGNEAVYSPERILALGARELEFDCTWPQAVTFVGPVLYTPPYKGPDPKFPDDGRPCVLISIGTHLLHAKDNVASAIRKIAERNPGIVFHFSHGNSAAPTVRQEANFHEYAYISYADHLPRYDLVVHHAGAGVTNHCLTHGIPSVVHPLDFDQFDYAARLVAAGVAIAAPQLLDLEPAILGALHNEGLRSMCANMSRVVSSYDAVTSIVDLLGDLAAVPAKTRAKK